MNQNPSSEMLFPFVKIVGQEEMKRALLLNIIDPSIGGVLIKGQKGTAKSTTVRSLNQILPSVDSSKGCVFHCDVSSTRFLCEDCLGKKEDGTLESEKRRMRVVELPLNVTEDRISGSLDIEQILSTGKKKYEPGVLAQANGNLLYVDEVNLLDDHIVDLLLDSAAMGWNYIEREGISFSHPSKFILVGTMNPEEGNLRPQLLDRFGMSVNITSEEGISTKIEIIKRRLEFDSDPAAYLQACSSETEELKARIERAKALLKDIVPSEDIVEDVARVTYKYRVEGHRADLAMIRAARANAALNGRTKIVPDDIVDVAPSILNHRIKTGPFDDETVNVGDIIACVKRV